jgi:DNA repair exonuclease SbcCD ATPase subunit
MFTYEKKKFDKKINHIYHISDIHIHLQSKHKEYQQVFKNLYHYLKNEKLNEENLNNVIVITGDILHSKTELTPECIEVTRNFFNNLSLIFPLIFIAGNHDVNLSNSERLDSLTPIYNGLDDKDNCFYLKDTGLYSFNNVLFSVSSIRDYDIIDPEEIKKSDFYNEDMKLICLFHGRVDGVILFNKTTLEGEINSKTNKTITPSSFKGYDLTLLGDIHKRQYLNDNKTIAYAGSLIQQNHGESLNNHGLIKWNVNTKESRFIDIENPYGYVTIEIINENITDIDLLKKNTYPKHIHLRIIFTNTKNSILNDLLVKLKEKYDVIDVVYVNNNVEIETKDKDKINDFVNNVDYQNKILDEILTDKFNLDDTKKTMIKRLNQNANEKIIDNRKKNTKWFIKKLEFSNLFSYSSNNIIDFSKYNNVVGIIAPNHVGKSALLDIILYTIYDKFSRKGTIKDIINNTKMTFKSKITIEMDGYVYTIEKMGSLSSTCKKVNLKINFLRQKNDTGIIEKLNEDGIVKTREIITNFFGSYDDVILTNISIQNNNNNFINSDNNQRLKEFERILNIDFIQSLEKQARKMHSEKKVIVNHLIKKCDSDKIVELKQQNKGLINVIQTKISDINKLKQKINEISEQILRLNSQFQPNIEEKINILEDKMKGIVFDDITQLKVKFENIKKNIKFVKLKKYDIQKIINDDDNKIFELISKSIKDNTNKIDKNIEKIKKIESEINDLYKNIYKIGIPVDYDNESDYNSTIDKFNNVINSFKLKVEVNEKLINLKEEEIIENNNYLSKNNNYQEQIKTNNKLLNELSQEELPLDLIELIENTSPDDINSDKQKLIDILKSKNKDIHDIYNLCKVKNVYDFLENYLDNYESNDDKKIKLKEDLINLNNIQEQYLFKQNENNELKIQISDLKIKNESILSNIDSIKENINKIKENYSIYKKINTKNKNKDDLELKNEKYNNEIQNYIKDKDLYNELITINNKIKISEINHKNNKELKDEYDNLIDKQNKNNEINNKLNELEENLNTLKETLDVVEKEKLKCDMSFVSNNTILQNVKNDILELQKYEKQMELFNYYYMGLKELPYYIIRKIIPKFEKKINDLLSIVTDFMVKVEIDDNHINLYLDRPIYNGTPILLNNCSGFEKFISSLSIRLALLDISHLPKPNFLAIDEGWGAFDSKNINNINTIFNYIKNKFTFILNVSHIQVIRGYCDYHIKLEKRDDGYSYIVSS